MKKIVKVISKRQSLSLVDDIVYSSLTGENPLDLHMSLLLQNVNVERKIITNQSEEKFKFPLILCLPGGGFTHCERNRIIPESQFLAEKGYIIASIDYRLSDQYSFPNQIIDVYQALEYLITNSDTYHIDIENIGVLGRSAGACLALMAGMNCYINKYCGKETSIKVKAVCSMYGFTDFNLHMDHEIKSHYFSRANEYSETLVGKLIKGSDETIQQKAQLYSPINNINNNMANIMMLHGDNDPIIPVNQARKFYEEMIQKKLEDKVEYYEIVHAGHGSKEFFQREIQEKVIEFYDKNLKGERHEK